jgi:Kef-type K+ transport system membrane component KefB
MNDHIYLYLALALMLCLLISKLMKVVKLPNVTGYLIVGLVFGPYCLKVIPGDTLDTLSFIPEIALGFIAFSIGAEFRISFLKKVGKSPVIIAVLEAFGAVLVVDLVLILTGQDAAFSVVLGAIAAATAPAATLMVVRQYKAKGPVTDTLLPVVALDDAAALMFFGLSVALARAIESEGGFSVVNTVLVPLAEIFGALGIGAVLGMVMVLLCKWFTGRGNRLAITIAFILATIGICDILGWSQLLACMMLSAVFCNFSKASETVFELTDRLTPPLFMLFFFLSGAALDLSILPKVGLVGGLYVIMRVAGKMLGAFAGAKISKAPAVVQKYLGLTLVPQAGVAIGLATTAMSVVPQYGPQIRTIILCGTVIYELTGPVITKLALKKAGEIA